MYNQYLNNTIRKVAEKAGLDRPVTYGEQVGVKKTMHTEPLYSVMHTHTARHTFVSIMARLGIDKEYIKIVTAHTNDAIIDKVYLHVTPEDKGRKLVGALLKNDNLKGSVLFGDTTATPQPTTPSSPDTVGNVPDLLLQQIQKDAVEHYKMQQQLEQQRNEQAQRDAFVREYGMTPKIGMTTLKKAWKKGGFHQRRKNENRQKHNFILSNGRFATAFRLFYVYFEGNTKNICKYFGVDNLFIGNRLIDTRE